MVGVPRRTRSAVPLTPLLVGKSGATLICSVSMRIQRNVQITVNSNNAKMLAVNASIISIVYEVTVHVYVCWKETGLQKVGVKSALS
jgi:hypothetical protein